MTDRTERQELLSYISDAHKDAYGFRPRGGEYLNMSIEELRAAADRLSDAVCEEIFRERTVEFAAKTEWLARLDQIANDNRVSFSRAMMWDMVAQGVDYYGLEHYCYLLGVSYQEQGAMRAVLAADGVTEAEAMEYVVQQTERSDPRDELDEAA